MFESRACSPVDGAEATKGNHPTHQAQGQQDARAPMHFSSHHGNTSYQSQRSLQLRSHLICSPHCLCEYRGRVNEAGDVRQAAGKTPTETSHVTSIVRYNCYVHIIYADMNPGRVWK
jgi:hypothetical protein